MLYLCKDKRFFCFDLIDCSVCGIYFFKEETSLLSFINGGKKANEQISLKNIPKLDFIWQS